MKTNLWLDDLRPAPEGWTWAKTVEEAKTLLLEGADFLSLDHDLGENQPTGYDLCLRMAAHNIWPKEGIRIHTANPVGRENMRAVINRYSPFVI